MPLEPLERLIQADERTNLIGYDDHIASPVNGLPAITSIDRQDQFRAMADCELYFVGTETVDRDTQPGVAQLAHAGSDLGPRAVWITSHIDHIGALLSQIGRLTDHLGDSEPGSVIDFGEDFDGVGPVAARVP